MNNAKKVTIEIAGREVLVTLRRHHWSRQLRLSIRSGQVSVSVPPRTPWYVAEDFLAKSKAWLAQHVPDAPPRDHRTPTRGEREQARRLVKAKLSRWGMYFAVTWGDVRIGNQKSRWGSCSSSGTLSFNWRLIELPEDLVDYVVVHELAHLVQPNHSPHFWAEVEQAIPDWRDRRKSLRAYSTSGITEG